MQSKDRKTAKSIFSACIYLLHTELNGEIPCNLYMLYKVSVHTVFNRVYSPVSAGEGMEESLAIATGRVVSGDCEAAAAANGRERCNTREWDRQYALSMHAG